MKKLKNIKFTYIFVLFTMIGLGSLQASDTNNKIIENAQKIKIISQSLAKNYFYINQGIQISSAKRELKRNILTMEKSIKAIENVASDQQTKDLIGFALFSSEELLEIMKEPYSEENGGLVLDYTESLLESSDTILKYKMPKEPNENVKMLFTVADMKFLLARAAKYYIAFSAGFTDAVNITQANIAVDKFGKLLEKVQNYNYPANISKRVIRKLARYWPSSKSFYRGIKKSELPTIIFISTKHMDRSISKLISYHQKQIKK